jgi:hypothetical protein
MMAKIVKGQDFKGVVDYVLDKKKGTEIIDYDGLRLKDNDSIIQGFVRPASMNSRVSKPVCHISLDFSVQDKDKLSNALMVQIARDYMQRMGIVDTQYIIGRHYDKEHPHIHLVYNRVDNNGKTISDSNDRFRSEKICKELTTKYGLYFSSGKENVKRHRLKEPDKTKYLINDALEKAVPKCKNWKQLISELQKQGIKTEFKFKSNSDEIQGVRFGKGKYSLSGSKIDRQFSFSKIDYQLKQNAINQNVNQAQHTNASDNSLTSILEAGNSILGSLLNPQIDNGRDDLDYTQKQRLKKKKRKFGRQM